MMALVYEFPLSKDDQVSLRLLGIGVLKYKTLRKSLKLLCEDDSYQLIASIEHDYQQSYWDLNIDIFDFYE